MDFEGIVCSMMLMVEWKNEQEWCGTSGCMGDCVRLLSTNIRGAMAVVSLVLKLESNKESDNNPGIYLKILLKGGSNQNHQPMETVPVVVCCFSLF